MADREHEYAIEFNSGMKDVIHVWWDGKRVACDNAHFHASLKEEDIGGVTIQDGVDFLTALPKRYNNGYISTRKVK